VLRLLVLAAALGAAAHAHEGHEAPASGPPHALFRTWTVKDVVCATDCDEATRTWAARHIGTTVSVAPKRYRSTMAFCEGGLVWYEFQPRPARTFLPSAYGASPERLGVRGDEVWAGRLFCVDEPIAKLVFAPPSRLLRVFDGGVFLVCE
jgi:hypothetical protein